MISHDELAKLLTLLKSNGVASFKDEDVALSFHVEQSKPQIPVGPSLLEDTEAEKGMPPDLRTDSINSYDSVMNWSSPPSADLTDSELPLTGDSPL